MPIPLAMIPAIISAGSAIYGMAMQGRNNRKQLEQSKKLQEQQIQGQKEMGQYNQEQQLELWEKTGYKAQMEQMRKAGLNVGLMYGSAGSGGSTQSQPGQVQGQQAQGSNGQEWGMGMQLGQQAAMNAAQIELLKAQTNKTNVEATKMGGVDTQEAIARTTNINTITNNQQIIGKGLQLDNTIKEVEANIATETEQTAINKIKLEYESLLAITRKQRMEANISEATYNDIIEQTSNQTTQSFWDIYATKQGISKDQAQTELSKSLKQKTDEEIKLLWEQNRQTWQDLSIKERNARINEIVGGFETSDEANYERWSRIIGNYGKAISGIAGAGAR